ncbi:MULTISPECIES: hypothetical protein [unclassified Streptomyces]|uniref:hypothetical protein n=1 Tax=unclassified Streptomyces TaxID=2593676 RepID=UPI00093C65FC|nr:hypothetical protein [Streptomyces sp. TSRI0281]OKI46865.1 hypothetical protein A6A29_25255 [Streptomyces sp. TSRI0281]
MSARRTATALLTALAALCAAAIPASAAPGAPTTPAPAPAAELLDCVTQSSVVFTPPLTATPRPTTVTLHGSAAPCVDVPTGPTAVLSGTLTATLNFSALSCTASTQAPGATADFTWQLANGTTTTSHVTGLTLTQALGAGTLTGTVTPTSPRLAGQTLTAVMNVTSNQPLLGNCAAVILGLDDEIPNSTLIADLAFT